MQTTESTPVLIIGGSLVGLSTALFLSWRGVKNIVIEKHVGSSLHPRAIGYTPRTMEFFRAVGIIDSIPAMDPNFRLRRTKVESLAGKWHTETHWTKPPGQGAPGQGAPGQGAPGQGAPGQGAPGHGAPGHGAPQQPRIEYTPHTGAAIAQDRLEPLLRNKAVELGTDLRQGVEFISFEQDSNGVTALVRERQGGKEYKIHAKYMVAADGFRSPVREALGITRKGRGYIETVRSILFRAPLEEYLKAGFSQFEVEQPDLKAFITTYQDGRWVVMFTDGKERDEKEQKEAMYKAIGRTDITAEIITTGCWELTALIANQYSSGRVFLAGDAAHTLPPTRGGFGANTGIDDAYNLAWKLEAVLSGKSTPKLLETYSDERQPIGWLRHQQTFARPDYAARSNGIADGVEILDDTAMELGQLYRSPIIIGTSDDLPPAKKPDEWAGQPGSRAQHLWITEHEKRVSTLDIYQRGWVIFSEEIQWKSAAISAQENTGISVHFIHVGTDIKCSDENIFGKSFGVGKTGATLIRPDGYVAWRSTDIPEDVSRVFTKVLAQVTCAAKITV